MEKLSIIIPAYNEEKNMGSIIKKIEKVKFPTKLEIIIVNDCSIDNTKKELERINKESKLNIRIFHHKKNLGKGGAIRTAIKNITGDIVIIQDADLEYDPNEIVKLIELMKNKRYDVVYGSRNLNKKNEYSYLSYYLGNVFLNKFTNFLYGTNLTDMETCYKLVPSEIIKKIDLKSNGFDIEPEITAKIIKLKYNIGEYPISYYPRSKKEGKKIRWRDGLIAIWTLLYWRFKKIKN